MIIELRSTARPEQLLADNLMDSSGQINASHEIATTGTTSTLYPNAPYEINPEDIPSEQTTSLAIECYLTHAEPIFHIASQIRCVDLLKIVFGPGSLPTEADTCELSAIAAVGCQFNNIDIPVSSLPSYAKICSRSLLESLGSDSLPGMRCFLGLSLRWHMENLALSHTFICKSR